MSVLLDTHAFIWWLSGSRRLPEGMRNLISTTDDVYVSAATAWEIATKHRLGKLPEVGAIIGDIAAAIVQQGFSPLPVTVPHAERAGGLQSRAKDPFDRMLIAQAITEDLALMSNEKGFDEFKVRRVW